MRRPLSSSLVHHDGVSSGRTDLCLDGSLRRLLQRMIVDTSDDRSHWNLHPEISHRWHIKVVDQSCRTCTKCPET